MNLWATKSIAALRAEAEATNERSLKRALGALNLTMLGIGAIIGAGIFVLTGLAGTMKIIIADGKHSYEFDYSLAEP